MNIQRRTPRSVRSLTSIVRSLESQQRLIDRISLSGIPAVIRRVEKQQAAISRAFALAGREAQVQNLVKANRHLQDLNARKALGLDSLARVHSSWLAGINSEHRNLANLASVGQIALSDVSYNLNLTGPLLDGIDIAAIERHQNIGQVALSQVQKSISPFTLSYRRLIESFADVSDVMRIPSFIVYGSTRELATTSLSLDVLLPPEYPTDPTVETNTDFCSTSDETPQKSDLMDLLRQTDPNFVSMYVGALEAWQGDNSDRKRQVLTSLRELTSHVMRKIAPECEVITWIEQQGETSYMDSKGRPTRRARLYFVSRNFNSVPLAAFTRRDVDAHLALIALYNRLHDKAVGLTDDQLSAIVLKTESFLTYILQVSEEPL